jgi:formate hydrogenlyase subunit 6/NADH:ubiquinone oxidoreductase subunit I
MNILTMLWRNLWHGAQTLRYPARPATSEGYRGLVRFNPELCTGCAICKFRCTARAIEYRAGKGDFVWSYDPAQCTFCGRCVEGCKAHALSQDPECPPIYESAGALKHTYTVARRPPAPKPAATAPPPAPDSASNPAQETHNDPA